MAEGYRGLLAPWIGGAANDPTATVVGYRGMLAPWAGGAGSLGGTATAVGFVGLLAPWMGGASAVAYIPPDPDPTTGPGGGKLLSGRATRIRNQNRALIAALTAMAAQGAFQ